MAEGAGVQGTAKKLLAVFVAKCNEISCAQPFAHTAHLSFKWIEAL